MIEATRILFLPIVQDNERQQSEDDLTALQNEGWAIVSVTAWTMGQVCILLNKAMPETIVVNVNNGIASPRRTRAKRNA